MEPKQTEWHQILATGTQTNGAYAVMTVTLPPFSAGPALHRHDAHVEGCYVVAGIVALTRGEETVVLSTGELQLLPPGEVHTWWNPASLPARLLLIYAPGGDHAELRRLALGEAGGGLGVWDTS